MSSNDFTSSRVELPLPLLYAVLVEFGRFNRLTLELQRLCPLISLRQVSIVVRRVGMVLREVAKQLVGQCVSFGFGVSPRSFGQSKRRV